MRNAIRAGSLVLAVVVLALAVPRADVATAASCTGTGNYAIGGFITEDSTKGVRGVTVTMTGPGGCSSSTRTGDRGTYSFVGIAKGTYTITPSKVGCAFTPPSRVVSIPETTKANFKAVCP